MSLAARTVFERIERTLDRLSVGVTVALGLALAAGTAFAGV
jgi:hypothetical protein